MLLKEEIKVKHAVKILRKRAKEPDKRSEDKHLIIFDLDKYVQLQDIAKHEKTNVSSVINNLYEEFLGSYDNPQKSIEMFAVEDQVPAFTAGRKTWDKYIRTLNYDQYKALDYYLNEILGVFGKRLDDY